MACGRAVPQRGSCHYAAMAGEPQVPDVPLLMPIYPIDITNQRAAREERLEPLLEPHDVEALAALAPNLAKPAALREPVLPVKL